MTFGALFFAVRARLDLSQIELAKVLRISQPTLSKIERSLTIPSAETLLRLMRLEYKHGGRVCLEWIDVFVLTGRTPRGR